ncbi:Vms1/Ankzf1 family peptidyl-tRNA hydrolase [Arthrobacter sp. ISL-30]|uniref:baeRF2 domain-containing protein n=1 Tax=Arthrobacter sp. ISL-30 TaxID=2819109 RepID=UPI001BE9E007|nr:Vms1/Ankzf1 family peptidyl-tRNA hydrolase [Arthrobacter sp. ISL-30]MBT2512451.1 hypothetical protein [Arthrobacter sp. ISL-30]
MSVSLKEYADLYRKQGPWCLVYVDAGTGTVDTLEATDVTPDNVHDALEAKGAGKKDLEAIEQALKPAVGEANPVSRFVLVRDGNTELNKILPGPLVTPERISIDPVPDLLPLVKHGLEEFPYVVAEVGRDDAEIRLHFAGRRQPADVREVEGTSENLKKVPGGGWSQGRFQHRTEEIWRRNADEVAGEIDRVIAQNNARLLVLAGDIRARGLVADQLSEPSKALLSVVDSHTHTGGADPELLNEEIEQSIARLWAAEHEDVIGRLAEQEGQANPESATGIGAVVHALQQAQVELLLLTDDGLSDHELLALDAEPWLATDEGESLNANVLGRVPAPAVLLRAAALTDARILLVPQAALPDGVNVAALLRWPTGPAVPGS